MTDTLPPETDAQENRPYHHGDLRRALIEAARTIVVRDGAQALSLRGVAREAGVSPAAPYHHFKDKQELVLAVGKLGFEELGEVMAAEIHRVGGTVAERITANGPLAVAATKRVITESRGWSPDDQWREQLTIIMPVFASKDAREGAVAFAETRAPNWTGT